MKYKSLNKLSMTCKSFFKNLKNIKLKRFFWSIELKVRKGETRLAPHYWWGCPESSAGKESAAMQEAPVWFLGWEDPLEKG